ncbi:MAG: SDR family NAD(P)-dependent oxidoreductase, partial [Deltaproteobacteria bacterium]|nr:SDR family NAD(P)-dependent oxidoreductase [Nannocystaceae bacterium]
RGDRLLATDRDIEALREHAVAAGWRDDRARVQLLDVTDAQAWAEAVTTAERDLGGIDVLANVAGYLLPGWVHEVDGDAIDRHFDVNVKGVALGMRAVIPGMLERARGHVINVASLAALAPIPGIALYSASKYAVRAYSLAAAQELRGRGVAVTVVCPDAVRTPMLELQRDYEQAAMTFSAPRVLEPEEVVQAILGDVLERRPLELFLPRHRGWLARFADVWPSTAIAIAPLLRRRGRARQRAR